MHTVLCLLYLAIAQSTQPFAHGLPVRPLFSSFPRIESTAPVSCQVCIPSWQLLYPCFCRGAGGYNPGAQIAKIAKMHLRLSAMAFAFFG